MDFPRTQPTKKDRSDLDEKAQDLEDPRIFEKYVCFTYM